MWMLFLVLSTADAKKPKPAPAPVAAEAERPTVETGCPAIGSVATFNIVSTTERWRPDGTTEKSATANDARMEVVQVGEERAHRIQLSNATAPIPDPDPVKQAFFVASQGALPGPFDLVTGLQPRLVDPKPLVDSARELLRIAQPTVQPLLGPEKEAVWDAIVKSGTHPLALGILATKELGGPGMYACNAFYVGESAYEGTVPNAIGMAVPVTGVTVAHVDGDRLTITDRSTMDISRVIGPTLEQLTGLPPEQSAMIAQAIQGMPVRTLGLQDVVLGADGWPVRWTTQETLEMQDGNKRVNTWEGTRLTP